MKPFLVGLSLVAVAVGGGIGYAALQTPGSSSGISSGFPVFGDRAERIEADGEAASSIEDFRTDIEKDSRTSTSEGGRTEQANTTRPVSPGEVAISESELNDLMTAAIESQPSLVPVLEASKGVTTTIEDGRIESGLVMNISEIPSGMLPAEAEEALEEMRTTFPFLANRDVYIGIEGSPKVVDGAMSLDDTNVRFGQLKLPIGSVAGQLGVSQEVIEAEIAAVLEAQGLTPEDIQVYDGEIVITGLPS
ncbi:MAG: hypothetical protein AAFP09_10180 [Cyanobacteria bacterium J06607_10]